MCIIGKEEEEEEETHPLTPNSIKPINCTS